MSTEENKAVQTRIVEEVFNKRNLALVNEFVGAKFVQHGTGGPEFKGPEGFKQFVTMNVTAFPDFRLTLEDMVAEGDKVATRFTVRGTHRGDFMGIAPTGKQFAMAGIVIGRIASGKMVEAWMVVDQLGMMQQVGAVTKQ